MGFVPDRDFFFFTAVYLVSWSRKPSSVSDHVGTNCQHAVTVVKESEFNKCCLNKRELFSTCVLFLTFTVGTFLLLL